MIYLWLVKKPCYAVKHIDSGTYLDDERVDFIPAHMAL
jgi:hypothetical protein